MNGSFAANASTAVRPLGTIDSISCMRYNPFFPRATGERWSL